VSRPSPGTPRPCPWPRCRKPIRPAYLLCRTHWYLLPAELRARITATYRRGQTVLSASPEYLDALRGALGYARRAAAEDDWPEERGVSEYNHEEFALDRGEELW
jgi:hypothetical protein